MNNKLKRCTAAGLVAIMLLVGFFAEYTHRHAAMPAIGQTTSAHPGSPQPGKSTGQQVSHDCFICHHFGVAINISPAFSLVVLNAQPMPLDGHEDNCLLASLSYIFLRRGPPAFLA